MTLWLKRASAAALLAATAGGILWLFQPERTNAQTPPESLPAIAIYDESRVTPLNRFQRYRIRIVPKPGYAHHLGVRLGLNLSFNSNCGPPDRVDELIFAMGWRMEARETFYPISIFGCAVGGSDSSRTIEARIWTTEDNTPPTDFDNPAADDVRAEVLTVQLVPTSDIPREQSLPLLSANKHLYLTSLTLYRTDRFIASEKKHGRANLEVTSVTPLQSVRPSGLYALPDADWRTNVKRAEVPMAARNTGLLNLEWWTPPPPDPPTRIAELANPFDQLTYSYMAIDHPEDPDGREWDLTGVRIYWQYQLDEPQLRYTDVRSVTQESLKGSLDLPRAIFLLPAWPSFARPDDGLPTMDIADTHNNTILDEKLLGSFCQKSEYVHLETVTIRPDRLMGTVVYTCEFETATNPLGFLPVSAFSLHDLTLGGSPLHEFNRIVRAKPVAAYGSLDVQVATGPTPPANWADVATHSFPLLPQQIGQPLSPLNAVLDVPLEPSTDLTGEYPTHFVRMSLDLTHDLEIPYDKHAVQGFGLPSRRLDFREVRESSRITIESCNLHTNVVSTSIPQPQPPPPAPSVPALVQSTVHCWAQYKEVTEVTPARWELLTDPHLAPPRIQASTVTANSRFFTPEHFVITTDFHISSVADINDVILTYPETNDITATRPITLDRPQYAAPVISRDNANPVALQMGGRVVVPLSLIGMDPTVNYDIAVTYPTIAATDARCSTRTLADTLTAGAPDNLGAYTINITIHACPTPGSGTSTGNINVRLLQSGTTRAQLAVPLEVQRYPTPTLRLGVSSSNIAFGGSTDISVQPSGLNPARVYRVRITLPSGLRFNPDCSGGTTATIDIRPFTLTHYASVRAYGCGAGTANITAALQLVTPSGPNPASDTEGATSTARQTQNPLRPLLTTTRCTSMMTKLNNILFTAHASIHTGRWLIQPLVLFFVLLAGGHLPSIAWAQTPPDPEPTVAPVYVEPDWQPTQIEYPVGWSEASVGQVEDSDRYIHCTRDHGTIRDSVEKSWRNVNCHVRRVVEGIVAASVGVALLTTAWAGFTYMLESQDTSKRGQSKMAVLTTLLALTVALLSYSIAGMLDNGIIPHTPWETESLTR